MAVVNVNLNNMINAKDSRWLQLEVCREFQRSKCSRSDTECKFAHPPANVEVQNGRVIACYDSIKGRCNREKPPCKYFHPPQHLKDQLLINGRNHLALKNALMLQMGMGPTAQSVLPGQIPTIDYEFRPVRCLPSSVHDWCEMSASPYLTGMPQLSSPYSHYVSASPMLQVVSPDAAVNSQLVAAQGAGGYGAPANKLQRSDRIEVCREYQRGVCRRTESECRFAHPPEGVAVEMMVLGNSSGGPLHLQQQQHQQQASAVGGDPLVVVSADPAETLPPMSPPPLTAALSSSSPLSFSTVTVCMDAVRGRCSRQPCRYFHPPEHLLDLVQQHRTRTAAAPVAHYPSVATDTTSASSSAVQVLHAATALKRPRDPTDDEPSTAYPGMMQYKRSAGDKTSAATAAGMAAAVYQHHQQQQQNAAAANASHHAAAAAAAAYQAQALMQLQQQPYGVPVSCEYPSSSSSSTTTESTTTTTSSSNSANATVHTSVTVAAAGAASTTTTTPTTTTIATTAAGLVAAAATTASVTTTCSNYNSPASATSSSSPSPTAPSYPNASSASSSSLSSGLIGGGSNNSKSVLPSGGLLQTPIPTSSTSSNVVNNSQSASSISGSAVSLALTNGNAAAYEAATLAALTNFSNAAKQREQESAEMLAAVEAEAAAVLAAEMSGENPHSHLYSSATMQSASSTNLPSGVKRPRSPSTSSSQQVPSLVAPFMGTSANSPSLLSAYGAPVAASNTSAAAAAAAAALQQHYTALQSQTALAYTGVSLNKQQQQQLQQQQQQQQQQSVGSATAATSGGSAANFSNLSALAAMQQQYQQYLNPYYSLMGVAQQQQHQQQQQQQHQQQQAAQNALLASAYGNPFVAAAGGGHSLLNGSSLAGLSLPGHQSQGATALQQQLAILQQSMQQNPGLMAAAAAAAAAQQQPVGYHLPGSAGTLGMYAANAGNPLSSLAHFNQQMMHPQYMSLAAAAAAAGGPAANMTGRAGPTGGNSQAAAAAAAAATAAMANAGLQPYKKMRTI